jgi:hypothetical protein
MNDGFSSTFSDWATEFFSNVELEIPEPSNTSSSTSISPKTPNQHIERLILWLQELLPHPEPVQKWFIVYLLGKRRIAKTPIAPTQLSPTEVNIWNYIQREFAIPGHKERIKAIMSNRKISKRLISYFIVHYVARYPTCYYLDRSSYPYRIVSDIGPSMAHITPPPHDDKIVFINVFIEYHVCLSYHVPQKCNAPYSRRNIVVDPTSGEEYSLSAIPYYIWLDKIGAMEAFHLLHDKVKAAKKEYEYTKNKLRGTNQKLSLKELSRKESDQPTNGDTFTRRSICRPYFPSFIQNKKLL